MQAVNGTTEYLGSGITAVISPSHGFGTDAVLLADFAHPSKKSVCCDLGTGCGIIPLLWCRGECGHITAVEIREQGCLQLGEALEISGITQRVSVVNADLSALKGIVPSAAFDIVTMNPPYKAENAGIECSDEARRIARHSVACTLTDICRAASALLRFGGRLCMCIRPERLCELFFEMRGAGVEPKRMRCVSKDASRAPWLVLVEGRRGGRPGMTVEAPLFIYGEDGGYSPEVKAMYADYLFENRSDAKG